MEAHLVHKADDGTLAVVGVMVVQGSVDGGITGLPAKDHPSRMDAEATALLPKSRDFYRYDGSLTTPACNEGVIWTVMQSPIEMSAEQIAAFQSVIGDNARPVQPLNGREILRSNK
jgi:carbonic anhydrase